MKLVGDFVPGKSHGQQKTVFYRHDLVLGGMPEESGRCCAVHMFGKVEPAVFRSAFFGAADILDGIDLGEGIICGDDRISEDHGIRANGVILAVDCQKFWVVIQCTKGCGQVSAGGKAHNGDLVRNG